MERRRLGGTDIELSVIGLGTWVFGGRWGGAITAAKFLENFVEKTPWVHLDIAGTSDTDKDKGYNVKGATGVPVRTLVTLALRMAQAK